MSANNGQSDRITEVTENEETQASKSNLTVTPLKVLLSSIELAVSRGAYRMNEMNLILQAYNMLNEFENKEENKKQNKELTKLFEENSIE